MKIQKFEIQELNIPLKVSFQHSTATRNETESVLVKAHTDAGNIGLGEGCPRSYVTGESITTALDFIAEHQSELARISSVVDLTEWVSIHESDIDTNPAAFSAIEISLLNALALDDGVKVEQLLGLPKIAGVFCYTAVLGTQNPKTFHSQLEQYKAVGFKDFKVKLFGEPGIDRPNLDILGNELGSGKRVRFDANNIWNNAGDAIGYLEAIGSDYFAIEEPVTAKMYADLALIHKQLGKQIILDESFLKIQDFEFIQEDPKPWIINLRISKMGGIIRSLSIAEKAKKLGIPIIIGAQVGETSILTRAAITVANAYRSNLIAQEGAFGTQLLSYDLLSPSLSFGAGGLLEFPQD